MNPTITWLGVELRLREIRRCQSQDLVRAPQLDILALELPEPRPFVRRQAGAPADVTLGLPHSAAQRLGLAPDPLGDRSDRRPLRRVFLGVLEDHPHRAFAHPRENLLGLAGEGYAFTGGTTPSSFWSKHRMNSGVVPLRRALLRRGSL